jgi:hypothetical protein
VMPPQRRGNLPRPARGAKGFDYSKIANDGSVLIAGAALGTAPVDWACTKDNITGLTWEVKPPAVYAIKTTPTPGTAPTPPPTAALSAARAPILAMTHYLSACVIQRHLSRRSTRPQVYATPLTGACPPGANFSPWCLPMDRVRL